MTTIKLRASELKLGESVIGIGADSKTPTKIVAIEQDRADGWERYTRIVFSDGTGWSFIPREHFDEDNWVLAAEQPAPLVVDGEASDEQYITEIENNLKTRDVQYVDHFGETDEFANVSDDAGTHMLWLVAQLRTVTAERDAAQATIVEALAAANEGRWNTVKTLLGGAA